MTHPLEQLRDDALREIEAARDEKSLEGVRVKYLGKSGSISEWGERMKTLGKEERPVVGKLLNQARNAVSAALDQRGEKVRVEKESDALASIDISLPGTPARAWFSASASSNARTWNSDFPTNGFCARRRSRYRNRVVLLRCSEYAARPPCPQRTGHFLFGRWATSANPHFHRANPRDGIGAASDPRDCLRCGVSARRTRRNAQPAVSSDRRIVRR